MTKPVAVFALTHPWMREMVLRVAPAEFDVRFVDISDRKAAGELLPLADFFMTTYLPGDVVPLLSRCRLVHHQGVGVDGIDTDALAIAGIPLAITPEGTVIGVAEHTVLLILAVYKQLVLVDESMRHRGEFDSVRWRSNSFFLYGKTLGIVGLGRIGQRAAELATAFEANLIYHDVFRQPETVEENLGITYVSFDHLLAEADIVSVHTPLTPETSGLFGSEEFARMRQGAIFINTSRGGTYDMDALYEGLRTGHLGGAGLDVFSPEPPPPDHPILQLENVVCTPHMATGTVDAHLMKATAQFENFSRVLRGESPHNIVHGS
ncbi:MAG: lactate dehydrogenase [Proteobacteria bacterium]|nr:lactate dehydrogenase [Pseudomonadota bacterium]